MLDAGFRADEVRLPMRSALSRPRVNRVHTLHLISRLMRRHGGPRHLSFCWAQSRSTHPSEVLFLPKTPQSARLRICLRNAESNDGADPTPEMRIALPRSARVCACSAAPSALGSPSRRACSRVHRRAHLAESASGTHIICCSGARLRKSRERSVGVGRSTPLEWQGRSK
jgi:hypothetical protein